MAEGPTTVISQFSAELEPDERQEVQLTRYWKSFVGRLFLITLALTVAAVAALSWLALGEFQRRLAPEFRSQSVVVTHAVQSQLQRALAAGVPIEALVGMDDYLDTFLRANPFISYIAVTDPTGRLLFGRGAGHALAASLPPPTAASGPAPIRTVEAGGYVDAAAWLLDAGTVVGRLHAGVAESTIRQQSHEIVFDVAIVTLVALLVAFEFILFTVAAWVRLPTTRVTKMLAAGTAGDYSWLLPSAPGEFGRVAAQLNAATLRVNRQVARLREAVADAVRTDPAGAGTRARAIANAAEGRLALFTPAGAREIWDTSLVFARTPLFLFVLAQEMCRPFFPNFVASVYVPPEGLPGLSANAAASLPIALAMLVAALLTPVSGVWSDRVGRRPIFVGGALVAAAGLALTAGVGSMAALLASWALGAVGYGMVFIACQGYVVDHSRPARRAQALAVYLGAIVAGDICGPAIGGVLADRLGWRPTFVVAAALTLLGAALAWRHMRDAPDAGRELRRLPRWRDFGMLARNGRLIWLLAFASVPGKVLLTGFLFYLVPIHLAGLGESQAVVGRVLMCYGVAALLVTPLAGRLARTPRAAIATVGAATMLQGLSVLLLAWRSDTATMVGAVALFGLAQALALSPQAALVTELAARETALLGTATVLGVYRLVERLGTVVGPLLLAALLATLHAEQTFALVGGGVVGGGALFLLLLRRERRSRRRGGPAAPSGEAAP